MQTRLTKCDNRRTRLTDAFLDGDISKDVYDQRNAALLAEQRDLQDRLDALAGEPGWINQYKEFVLNNSKLLRYETLNNDEKRELVSALCSDFGVQGKSLVISLRSPYQDIAKTLTFHSSGPKRVDVRTLGKNIDTVSIIPANRAQAIFAALRSRIAGDDTPAATSYSFPTKSLKSTTSADHDIHFPGSP